MQPLIFNPVDANVFRDQNRISMILNGKRLYYQTANLELSANTDSFVVASLLQCMTLGQDMIVNGVISERLACSLNQVQDMFCTWDQKLSRIEIKQFETIQRKGNGKTRVGVFFTGGIDSFYSLLMHNAEITDLIYVHGFDLSLRSIEHRADAIENALEVAKKMGKDVVEVESNFESWIDPSVNPEWSYGAGLASVGLILHNHFQKIYIAGDFDYARLRPAGTHPLLDPLWGTESLSFHHDGCESSRLHKVSEIACSTAAMEHLRVCFKNNPMDSQDVFLNCGKCEKCLRTMTELLVHGKLEASNSFSEALAPENVAHLRVMDWDHCGDWEDCLVALEAKNCSPKLQAAIRKLLCGPDIHDLKQGMRVVAQLCINPSNLTLTVINVAVGEDELPAFIEGPVVEFGEGEKTVMFLDKVIQLPKDLATSCTVGTRMRVNTDKVDSDTWAIRSCEPLSYSKSFVELQGDIESVNYRDKQFTLFGLEINVDSNTVFDRDSFARYMSHVRFKKDWHRAYWSKGKESISFLDDD